MAALRRAGPTGRDRSGAGRLPPRRPNLARRIRVRWRSMAERQERRRVVERATARTGRALAAVAAARAGLGPGAAPLAGVGRLLRRPVVRLGHPAVAARPAARCRRSATWRSRRRSSTRPTSRSSRSSRNSASRCRSSRSARNVRDAVVSVEDQRFYEHNGVDVVRIGAAVAGQRQVGHARAGRQHHHAAARAHELPEPQEDLHPQDQGSVRRAADRADLLEGRDPRAVPEQGVLRRRLPRRRGGLARLPRQARQRARRPRGRADRRPDPVAVGLRADDQHGEGDRAPQHRAAT